MLTWYSGHFFYNHHYITTLGANMVILTSGPGFPFCHQTSHLIADHRVSCCFFLAVARIQLSVPFPLSTIQGKTFQYLLVF